MFCTMEIRAKSPFKPPLDRRLQASHVPLTDSASLSSLKKFPCTNPRMTPRDLFQGKDLPAKDLSGTSDPYVRVTLLPDKKHRLETKIKRRTLNPRWNETFYFEGERTRPRFSLFIIVCC